ncbi:hypothetical protein CEE37_06395 [candidate division LCP-89 bacterium B3_LCP]|uniref:Secretion system C-terminal sorting domain-containing protein n=1 Tax=candidate division LCP-89 bacterium B3_LCP TaxID=2012998 RepID=A0A532V258_UNCL8|nr:MAG: hypothetical protein CEE37_06395 [candidate division LCP-89 bacterium B3_LCP]
MKKTLLIITAVVILACGLQAQPYLVTATNYASGFFGVVADENGQPLSPGSIVHLIWDSAGDGMDDPSVEPGFYGMPTDDDVLMGTCQVGFTGGAPSAGNFILPGTAPSDGGWSYLRAFHSSNPEPETYYAESTTLFIIPPMDEPVIYGVEFPSMMSLQLGNNPDLVVTASPENPPIIINATGGNFNYTLEIINDSQDPVNYDVWIDVILPNGAVYGPIISRIDLTMPSGGSISRDLTQSIPAGAPEGIYTYMVHTGDMISSTIIHEDGFPFEKSGAVGSDGLPENMEGWQLNGWDEFDLTSAMVPEVYFMAPPFPNPFNPSAQIQFGLPENSHVRIDVYNILGSRVTTLVDRGLEAGYHNIQWNAPSVASGLYLIQMKAGGFVHTRKAFLLK